MNRIKEEALKVSLTDVISGWLQDDEESGDFGCYVGEDLAEIMASAALAVLRGVVDAQSYLKREGMLKD